jgi:hypothetical protein
MSHAPLVLRCGVIGLFANEVFRHLKEISVRLDIVQLLALQVQFIRCLV